MQFIIRNFKSIGPLTPKIIFQINSFNTDKNVIMMIIIIILILQYILLAKLIIVQSMYIVSNLFVDLKEKEEVHFIW